MEERGAAPKTKRGSLETLLAQHIRSTNETMDRMEYDMKRFKEEVRADIRNLKDKKRDSEDDVRVDSKKRRNERDRDIDDAYLKWAERANKIGTLAELIVSPRIPEIAMDYFGDDDFDFFGHQTQKRNMKDRSLRRDFDIVAATEKNFFVINTTSHPSPEGAENFAAMLEGLQDYFPECKGKKIIPILSALRFPEEIQEKLTRLGIYTMGMKEGTMGLLNFEQVLERK